MKDILKEVKLKATPPRVAVLNILIKSPKPLAIEELLQRLGSSAPDMATVYRNMKQMADAGLVRRIDFKQGRALYEHVGKKDHHHIVCTRCGRIENFDCDFKTLSKKALKQSKHFGSVLDHSMELYGLCKNCKK